MAWFAYKKENQLFPSKKHAQVGLIEYDSLISRFKNRHQISALRARDCTIIQLRFLHSGPTDLKVEAILGALNVDSEFYIAAIGEKAWRSDFVMLVEDVNLPDDVAQTVKYLHSQLADFCRDFCPEQNILLEPASYPFDDKNLDRVLALSLDKINQAKQRRGAFSTGVSVELNEKGIAIVDYGSSGQVTAQMVEEVYELYKVNIAADYPGIKIPQLAKAKRMLNLDRGAVSRTRNKTSASLIAAVAVAPQGLVEKHLMKMYAYYSRPPYPFRVFDKEEDALAWLEGFVTEEFLERKAEIERES